MNDSDRPDKYDGGGRVTLKIPITSGPSWDKLWEAHVRRGWNNRSDTNIQHEPQSRTVARRLSAIQRGRS